VLATALVGALAVLTTLMGRAGAQQAAQTGLNVAVVDIARVLRESQQWQDKTEELAARAEQMNRALRKLTERLQILRNEYENLPPLTDERKQKAAQVERSLGELEQRKRGFEMEIAEANTAARRTMFREIASVVADHARENGVSLVLRKVDWDASGVDSIENELLMATTEVLYATPEIDVSEAIVAALNSRYAGPIEVK
jgi:Skp family chaperone for outer membrane proteins